MRRRLLHGRTAALSWQKLDRLAHRASVWQTQVPKSWTSTESEGAKVLVAEQLVPPPVLERAQDLIHNLSLDYDEDSVDGSPTFEVRWIANGEYTHAGMEAIFRETIETHVLPLLQESPLCPQNGRLALCEGLVRAYDDESRRVHPAHYDADALVTALFELDAGGYEGPGFYLQPGAHVSSRLPMSGALKAGDLLAHSFDLQHGVEVHAGRRWSVVLWFTCSDNSCHSKERPWYESAASAGDVDAMYNLGKQVDSERSDPRRALSLMRTAAAAGSFTAQNDVAAMLLGGRGCPNAEPLTDEAEKWLTAAASQGFYRAQFGLSRLLASRGETAAAVTWLHRAAEQRADPDILFRLGAAYLDGSAAGLPRDVAQAEAWLREAAQMGHPRAQYALGAAMTSGDIPRQDEGEQREQQQQSTKHRHDAPDEAELWLRRAHVQGEMQATRELARRYVKTWDVRQLRLLMVDMLRRWTHVSSKRSRASRVAQHTALLVLPLSVLAAIGF